MTADRIGDEASGPARPHGGLVRQTGIALVHEGEMVVPASGSEAEIVLAEQDARNEIHVHLPVVVEVHGTDGHARAMEQTIDETLRRLRRAIEAQPDQPS